MVKVEKFDHLYLVYHFTVPLTATTMHEVSRKKRIKRKSYKKVY